MTRRKITWIGGAIGLAAPVMLFFGHGSIDTVSPFLPNEAADQIAALQRKLGGPAKAVSVEITPKGLTLELQSASQQKATDSWEVWHMRALRGLIDWIHVGGPTPIQMSRMDVPLTQRTFDLQDINFKVVSDVAKASAERVALEESSVVEAMHIARSHIFLPYEQAGPVSWTIDVRSPHESAEAFADSAGRLTGVNLDGTLRAQTLDLYQGGKSLLDIVHQIGGVFGNEPRISKMLVYSKSIRFAATGQENGQPIQWYDSGINGVRRDRFETSAPPTSMFDQPDPLFSAGEVDWSSLDRLTQAAREQLQMADAKVALLDIRKRGRGFASPAIEWDFDLQPPSGPSASIVLDTSGKPLEISWPRGQEKPRDMMSPAMIGQFLNALRQQLGAHADVMEITLTPTEEIAEVRTPGKPTLVAELRYDGYSFRTFGDPTMMPGKWLGLPYEDDWLFDLNLVDEKLLSRLPALDRVALEKLNIPGGKVRGATISLAKDMFENNRRLLIEIAVQGDNRLDGRIFFAPDDRVIRMDAP